MYSNQELVFIPCGGGLGDVIQCYLANPITHDCQIPLDQYQTSDNYISIWFRRLESFREKHPDVKIKVISNCHNPAIRELFEYHPSVDLFELWKYGKVVEEDKTKWEREHDGFRYIRYCYDYHDYKPSDPVVYMSDSEYKLFFSINSSLYIVLHPFAGIKHRMPISTEEYYNLAKIFISKGYRVVVIGGSYTRNTDTMEPTIEEFPYYCEGMYNLVGGASVRLFTNLCMNAAGFIGTHSSMILPAWYAGVKSVCIVPSTHDGGQPWEEFASSGNPTAWGFKQDFNKTVITSNGMIDIDEVVEYVCGR